MTLAVDTSSAFEPVRAGSITMDVDLLAGLDPQQYAAATSDAQRLLVIAGAGSGKTRTFVHRIAHLVSQGVPAHEILALSYTKDAAAEAARRLQEMGIWSADCTTIHAWCNRQVLQPYGHLVGHETFSIIGAEGTEDVLTNDMGLGPVNTKRVMTELTEVKNLVSDKLGSERVEEYNGILASRGQLDFDDLQVKALQILQDHPAVLMEFRRTYKHVLVDEYQDINPIQHELVSLLCEPIQGQPTPGLSVVGDFRQAIYSFRGSDPDFIRDFDVEYPDAQIVELSCNYRSTPQIIEAADRLVHAGEEDYGASMWTINDDGDEVEIRQVADSTEQDGAILDRIRILVACGTPCNEIALLYRYKATGEHLADLLDQAGVPFRYVGPGPHGGRQDEGGVHLSTIHSAKGLEWDVVISPDWIEGALPSFRAFDSPAELAEERRVAYVAITRARKELLLLHPSVIRIKSGGARAVRPSRFLDDVVGTDEHERGWRVG